jgi:hypothetical protein
MVLSENADRLRKLIEKSIKDHVLTMSEYNSIRNMALEDNIIDRKEQMLFDKLQDMAANMSIRFVP